MSEKTTKKHYDESSHPCCPNCECSLEWHDHGSWLCPNCDYWEENNLTVCQAEWCNNLVKYSDCVGAENYYCQIKDENGMTCLAWAKAESEGFCRGESDYEKDLERKGLI